MKRINENSRQSEEQIFLSSIGKPVLGKHQKDNQEVVP